MKQHKDIVNSLSLKEDTELLATGASDGNIVLTNLITYR
jgi:WD40 repeat protein